MPGEPETRERRVEQPNAVKLGKLQLPVSALRQVGTLGGALGLVLTGLLAAIIFGGLGLDEFGQIQARYGPQLIAVAAANLDGTPHIEVATFHDLARQAKQVGSLIGWQASPDSYLFFLPDGAVVYTYRVPRPGAAH